MERQDLKKIIAFTMALRENIAKLEEDSAQETLDLEISENLFVSNALRHLYSESEVITRRLQEILIIDLEETISELKKKLEVRA